MKKSLSEMQGSLSFSILADHQVARRMKQSVHVAGCINVSLDRQTRPQSPSYVKTKMNSVHFVTGAISRRAVVVFGLKLGGFNQKVSAAL